MLCQGGEATVDLEKFAETKGWNFKYGTIS